MAEQAQNPVPGTGTVKLSKIKLDPARELMAQAASQIPVAPHRQSMTPAAGTISATEQKTITPPTGASRLTLKLRPNLPLDATPAAETPAPAEETPAPAPQKLDTTTMRLKIRRQPSVPAAMPAAPATASNPAPATDNAPASGIAPLKLKPLSTSSSIPVTAATPAPAAPAAPAPAVTKRPTVAIPAATVDAFVAAPKIQKTEETPAPAPIPAPATAKEVSDDATVKIARPSRSVPVGTPGSLIPNAAAAQPEAAAPTETAAKTIKLTAAMKPLHTQTATSPVPKVKPIPQPVAAPASEATAETAPHAAKTIKLTAAMKPQLTQTATSPVPKVKPIPVPPTTAPGRDPIAAKTIKLTAAIKPQMTQTATSPVPKISNVQNIASAPTVVEKVPEQQTATQPAPSAPTIKLTAPVTEAANNAVTTSTVKLTPPKLATLKKPEAAPQPVTPSAPTVIEKAPEIQTPAAVEPSAPTVSELEETLEEQEETPKKKGFNLSALKNLPFLKPKKVEPAEDTVEDETVLPGETTAEEAEVIAPATGKAEPGAVFLTLSIVAMLALIFCLFVMTVQYLNMYEGKNIKVPGWEELSGVKK